jgi:cobalt-zinc-cadmium efflux system membrane fusion protein
MQQLRFAAVLAALFAVIGVCPLAAHEGHDHDAEPPAAITHGTPRAEASSDLFELVVMPQGREIVIFVDRFDSNEPVEGATIEVETPDGPVPATPDRNGGYRIPADYVERPGHYDLIVTVSAGGATDVLPVTLEIPESAAATVGLMPAATDWLGRPLVLPAGAAAIGFLLGVLAMATFGRRRNVAVAIALLAAATVAAAPVRAHDGEDHGTPALAAPAPARDLAQRLPDGSVFVPKATQRILAIRTVQTTQGSFRRSIELPGRVIPDPNASGFVQAATGGRLSPPPGGFPKLGTTVRAGDVLAFVTPPIQTIDISDMRQKQGELDQQIAIVERRVNRYVPLAQSGAVAQVQLDESRLELQGLQDRRAALERVRREPEALTAPVAGIVADGVVAAGQIVQPNTVIFQIVDPARLWIEALSFEALPAARASSTAHHDRVRATARTAAGRSLSLTYQGAGFADRNQSIPVHFAIEGDREGLRLGQFVTVLASRDEQLTGLALPRSSVVRAANGQDIVFEHVTAERFQPRPVRSEPLDGERLLIATGIGPGARIVVQGAELLDQVR